VKVEDVLESLGMVCGNEAWVKCPESMSREAESNHTFGRARRPARILWEGQYACVSTNDRQTLAMQNGAMLECAARRGCTKALQVLS
jgi:hypothetical protein